jgi:hypothetical protein
LLVSLFANLLAALAIFPLLTFLFIYAITKYITKDKKTSMGWAINISTVLILISVHMTILYLWKFSLFWLILLIVLVIVAGLTFLQFSMYSEMKYGKLMRGVTRLTFVLFLPIHLLLIFWVVLRSAIGAAT